MLSGLKGRWGVRLAGLELWTRLTFLFSLPRSRTGLPGYPLGRGDPGGGLAGTDPVLIFSINSFVCRSTSAAPRAAPAFMFKVRNLKEVWILTSNEGTNLLGPRWGEAVSPEGPPTTGGLHPAGCVDGVPEQAVAGHLQTNHSSTAGA